MTLNNRTRTSDPPGHAPGKPSRAGARARLLACCSIAAALLAAVMIAGCGGSTGSNASVAHIDTSTTTAKRSSNSKTKASGVAYSQCMRAHGEPDFPDPNSHGDFAFSNSSSMNPQSPTFQAAQTDCRSLQPQHGSAAQESAELAKVLKAAACIRKNGYPSLPDPTMSNGAIGVDGNAMKGIDVNSPAFQAVAKKCGAPGALF